MSDPRIPDSVVALFEFALKAEHADEILCIERNKIATSPKLTDDQREQLYNYVDVVRKMIQRRRDEWLNEASNGLRTFQESARASTEAPRPAPVKLNGSRV